ncbi:MAG: NADH-quinone oxidoreductase subunit M [Bdellovibrionales bacterium]|nr:NADH-quinone oxidoreductase subunit M [Bdellovibrionales bacterium]
MLLSLIVFLPLLFALVLAILPKESWIRPAAFGFALIQFAVSLLLFKSFDPATPAVQLAEFFPWVPALGISYLLGIDGISFWLVLLTTFLLPVVVLGSWTAVDKKSRAFHCALFALQTAMLGSFVALDLVLFYVFFELSLVPMYFIIGIWGGQRRVYATMKFFLYTMVGSLLMLLGIIYLMFTARDTLGYMTANVLELYKLKVPFVAGEFLNPQSLLFFVFSLAFAIKVPMFPVHTWLPDAHVEAPTPGSVVLAGVMLKMGTYGFLRFVIPLFPEAAEHYAWVFLFLGAVGIVYGALVAMVQPDMKKLVAYSSVSHMGYVVLGLFAMNSYGVTGAIYQMLNHGVSTGALFLLVGMIYERTHSREIERYGGLAKVMPIYTILFFIVTLSSIAVPMTNGFVGEFLILLGGFQANKAFGSLAVVGVVLGAVYMLWMFKRVFFGEAGPLVKDEHHPLHDVGVREFVVMVPLVILIFWMGLMPEPFLKYTKASVEHFVANKDAYQLTILESPVETGKLTAAAVADQKEKK